MSWDVWWIWGAAALGLGIIEILAPGFVFLGLAIGAGLVAGLLAIDPAGIAGVTGSFPALLVLFAVVSILSYIVLRRVVGVQKNQVRSFDRDINE